MKNISSSSSVYVPGGRYDYLTLSGRGHVERLSCDWTNKNTLSHIEVTLPVPQHCLHQSNQSDPHFSLLPVLRERVWWATEGGSSTACWRETLPWRRERWCNTATYRSAFRSERENSENKVNTYKSEIWAKSGKISPPPSAPLGSSGGPVGLFAVGSRSDDITVYQAAGG